MSGKSEHLPHFLPFPSVYSDNSIGLVSFSILGIHLFTHSVCLSSGIDGSNSFTFPSFLLHVEEV